MLKSMKLAYLTSRFPFAHLGEAFLTPEVRVLAQVCDELHVLAARPQLKHDPFATLGARTPRIVPGSPATLAPALVEAFLHPVRTAMAFWQIAFGKYPLAAKLKNVALFPKALAVAAYVRKHDIDHIHAHWLTTSSTVGYVAHLMTGVPWSITAHAHDIYGENLTAQKIACARFVRVISARNRDALDRLTSHRYSARLRIGHLGVDVPPEPAPSAQRRAFTMLCPARLHPMKGHRDLLQALARVRDAGCDFRCDLAGDGELREEIAQLIAQLDLERWVTMRGIVKYGDLLAEIRGGSYDAIVLASIEDPHLNNFFEGIPVALMEPMACGVPCIATSIGSIPELIDERTGILIRQHDPDAFAMAILRLAQDPVLATRLGQAARERIADEFNAVKTARALYDSITLDAAREETAGHGTAAALSSPENMPAANAN